MENSNRVTDQFSPRIESGSLKFSLDYCSRQQIYDAAKKWADSDKNVLVLTMREGGKSQVALDFRYDASDYSGDRESHFLKDNVYMKFFEKELGQDCLSGWDYSKLTIVIR